MPVIWLPVPVPVRGPYGLLAEDALAAISGRWRGWSARPAAAVGSRCCSAGDCPVILGALAAVQAERGRAGLLFADGHEDAWPPRVSQAGEAADCELGLAPPCS